MIKEFREITKGEEKKAYLETRLSEYGAEKNIDFRYCSDQSRSEVFSVIVNLQLKVYHFLFFSLSVLLNKSLNYSPLILDYYGKENELN